MADTPAPRPREQLPIPLFDGAVLAVRAADGRIFLSLRDLCTLLGLVLSGQRRRIRSNARLALLAFRVIIQGCSHGSCNELEQNRNLALARPR